MSDKEPRGVLVIGAGGHGKVVADILLCGGIEVLGFLDDDKESWGQIRLALPVLGPSDAYRDFTPQALALGIGDNRTRQRVVESLGPEAYNLWCNAIHPGAYVAASVQLGTGIVIAAGSAINPDSVIGDYAIINTGATVDHDCLIGPYAHVAPGVHLSGGVHVGQGTLIGVENRLSSIMTGTTTLDFVYDANGKRLLQSVAQGSSTERTLYVGNLYEETVSAPEHSYIVYYYLGAKMAGERKGNYSSGNGQYRMVGDQLGSTTLTVDTASPPSVVYRAYYKPYGEVAFQSGSKQTTYGYTGQRLDGDSGLMYYGARYYDPVLSMFVSADPTVPDAGNLKDYNKYLYVRGNPLRYLDSLGYGPEDYYVFVYGCVSGPCEDPASKQFGEFEALLREEYNAWAAEAEYLNKRYGEDTLPPWETWRKEHLIGVQAPDTEQGRKNLMAALAKIPGDANINLWGHSAGGGAILSYLTGGMEGYNSVDQRIASVAMIDPYLSDADATTANGLFWWSSELKDYLYANTRVKSGALLQVNVDWSIVSDYQRCIDGFSCRKADYSKSNPAGKPGPAFPVSDIFNKDYRTAWHTYSFFVAFNTNFEDWFRQYWK